MIPGENNLLFKISRSLLSLQNLIIKMINLVHPSIEHNVGKYEMLKKALFFCELEGIEGSYFEFGIFEGASLFSAAYCHRKMRSKFQRRFYGFDSFEEGFKYFMPEDSHSFP